MRSLPATTLGAVIIRLLLCVTAAPLASGQVTRTRVVDALERDLTAIPSGPQATEAQKQVVATDLSRLFRKVNSPPTVTLDFVAGKLADAVAQGQILADDLPLIVPEIVDFAAGQIYDVVKVYDNSKVVDLEASLAKTGIGKVTSDQLGTAMLAVVFSRRSYTEGSTRELILHAVDPAVPGYKHISGNVEIDTFIGPQVSGGMVTDPYFLSAGITVELFQLPLGKYQVSVTTTTGSQPVALGMIRVRPDSSTSEDLVGEVDDNSTRARAGGASFGNFYPGSPLPTGFLVDDIVSLTVTDEQGIPRMTGSFTDPSFQPSTTYAAEGHLTATAAAPTAGGSVSALFDNNPISQSSSLLFSAVGLPINTTLMFSVDGTTGVPVTTGPTGYLYVKTNRAGFPLPPRSTEVINVLPDTVDLSMAASFAVSDVEGNVLLSASTSQ